MLFFFLFSPLGYSSALTIVHISSFVCISYSPKVRLEYIYILTVTIFPNEFPRAFRNHTAPATFWNGPFPCISISPMVIALLNFTYTSLLLIRKALLFDIHIYCKYSFVFYHVLSTLYYKILKKYIDIYDEICWLIPYLLRLQNLLNVP